MMISKIFTCLAQMLFLFAIINTVIISSVVSLYIIGKIENLFEERKNDEKSRKINKDIHRTRRDS